MQSSVQQATAPTLSVIDGKATTTSNEVAQQFGKRHERVLDAARTLIAELPENVQHNFVSVEYTDAKGEKRPAYRLTRDGFTLLAMGFTGKRALTFKLAYIDAFNRMEAQLVGIAAPTSITPAQAQHLRELVQLVVESGKQSHGETWSRLHRKMHVNSYLALRSDQFEAARQYLGGKFDDTSLAAIARKHFPQLALQAPEMKPIAPTPLPFGVDALCAFIGSGLIDQAALLKVADASGMALYIGVTNEKDAGWGQAVADQIDDTLPQADLRAIVNKSVRTLWGRAIKAAKTERPLPQRSHFNA